MIYLMCAILSSAMVSIVMRLSDRKVTGNFAMLVMNYLMCSLLSAGAAGVGNLFDPSSEKLAITTAMGCMNGVLYLVSFVLLQVNVRRNGVVLSSTFMKLGLLVTMVVSICFYGEMPNLMQTIGFVLAVAAIILINYQKDTAKTGFRAGLICLLLCGGMADAMSKVFEEVGKSSFSEQFLFYTFAVALVLCIGVMVYKKQHIGKKELAFGIMVGIPNFFSAKFLLKSLETVDAVIAYPSFSVATILIVTLVGVAAFKEKLKKRQWAALCIILVALVLLNI